jgi:hypothetical protein
VTPAEIRKRVEAAFADVVPPEKGEILLPRFRNSEDALETAAAFAGRRWSELSVDELATHRESLIVLGAEAYRAWIPAYLAAALGPDPLAGELSAFAISSLRPLSSKDRDVREAKERTSLLDPAQRAAIGEVLRWLADERDIALAKELLPAWVSGSGPRRGR